VRFFFGSFLCHFPWARLLLIGTGLDGGQKGCLQRAATARTADRKRTVHILAMISIGRMRVMNKQKKKAPTSPSRFEIRWCSAHKRVPGNEKAVE